MKYQTCTTLTLVIALLLTGVPFVHAQVQTEARVMTQTRDADSDDDGVSEASDADTEDEDGMDESDDSTLREDDDGEAVMSEENGSADADVRVRAQSHNSSRSNRTEGVMDDSTEEGKEEDDARPFNERGTMKALDIENPGVRARLNVDASSPLRYPGISLFAPQECPENGDCDDGAPTEEPTRRNLMVRVSGDDVRGWDEDKKAAVRARLERADSMNTANDFGIRTALAALENKNIVEVESDPERTTVTYNEQVHLFGFIPMNVTATAQAHAQGGVSVDYPWYGFLTRKSDQREEARVAAELRIAHNAMMERESE